MRLFRKFNVRMAAAVVLTVPSVAQVDEGRAAQYFAEAAALCERDAGRLWGVSLCGPIALVDAQSRTRATSQPPPAAEPPAAFGFANTAMEWGGARWTTVVWRMIPVEAPARRRLLMHELFHRIQPRLALLVNDGQNPHLDTLEGRYWLQLEWRALAEALHSQGPARIAAVRDALAFRAMRHRLFPDAAENERRIEINEGLAQYTGTVLASDSAAAASADTIDQLTQAVQTATFVRTFAYPLGAAYGLLLDSWSPGWTRGFTSSDSLAARLAVAARLTPAADAAASSRRYGGEDLRRAEEKRDAERQVQLADLRRRFVEGPVLVLPRGNNASFISTGMTPVPGAGTIYPSYRVTAPWGSLEAASVLMSLDHTTLAVPAPPSSEGRVLKGEGWKLTLAPGWSIGPGARKGDFQVKREP
ncbi:MAG: hypothetical protein HY235_13060 [Acidobacteria bacterium]|nr:hypothetical protein [Acidobacteriota bacterium]